MTGFDLNEFATDEVKELEGIWVYFDEDETQGILVARAWNENFNIAFRKLPRGFQTRAKMQTIDTKSDKKVWHKLLAATILLDWRGIADKGKSLGKYTPDLGKKYLDEYKGFTSFVWDTANEEHLYHTEKLEEDEKNSPASSGSG